jgi:CheY-like chemotaxis protein
MPRASRHHVLLISRAPEAHRALLHQFRRTGAQVFFARNAARAISLLGLCPDLVLVDLAIGAELSPALVQSLNRPSGSTLVVALHDGHLETVDEHACHLSVQGYCRAADLAALGQISTGAAIPASLATH